MTIRSMKSDNVYKWLIAQCPTKSKFSKASVSQNLVSADHKFLPFGLLQDQAVTYKCTYLPLLKSYYSKRLTMALGIYIQSMGLGLSLVYIMLENICNKCPLPLPFSTSDFQRPDPWISASVSLRFSLKR